MISNVYMIDYNSKVSLKAANLPVRKYPRLFPIPNTVVNKKDKFIIPSNMNKFELYPELCGLINNKGSIDYNIGLAIWTDTLVKKCNNPSLRDQIVNTYYGYYWDSTKMFNLTNNNLNNKDIKNYEVELSIYIDDVDCKRYYKMNKLLFTVKEIIDQMKRFIDFHKGDLICLGRVHRGIILNKKRQNNNIKIELNIPGVINRSIFIERGV